MKENKTNSHQQHTANLFNLASVLIIIGLITIQTAYSQVPMRAKDNKSSINISDFENVNLSNGSLSISLPLVSIGGRGIGLGLAYKVSPTWRRDEVITGYSGAQPNVGERFATDPYEISGILPNAGGYLVGSTKTLNTVEFGQCSNETLYFAQQKSFSLNFNGFGGQSFTFVSQQVDSDTVTFNRQGCWGTVITSLGSEFLANDGSGTKFVSDSSVILTDDLMGNGYGTPNFYPSGLLKFTDGTTYRIDGGLVSWIQDRNGNKAFITNTGFVDEIGQNKVTVVKDSLNREIQITSDANFQYVTYKGFGGATRTIKISNRTFSSTTQMLKSVFPWLPTNHPANQSVAVSSQNYIELPNGKRYTLTYDTYGNVTKIELPTGGKIEYDHEIVGANYYGATQTRLKERRIYADGINLDNKTQYSYSSSVPSDTYSGLTIPNEKITTVKLIDNQSNTKSVSKSYFYGCIQDGSNCIIPASNWGTPESAQKHLEGREFKSEIYNSSGTTLLRKTEIAYEPRMRAGGGNFGNPFYRDYRVTNVQNYLSDSGQLSKVVYGYNPSVPFNQQTDIYEYNFGLTFVRRTHTDYLTNSNYTNSSVNLVNLPLETRVSSDYNSNVIVSRTKYEYDNYASGTYTAPLVDCPNITGHNSNYGTTYTTRGNVTKVMTFADAQGQTGAVSVYTQYDIAGNIIKAFDGKGYASTISYDDDFGSPDAETRTNLSNSIPNLTSGQQTLQTFAFATSATNIAGYTTYAQFDYYSGAGVDAEDINGNISTTFYNDSLDRPTQTISANNRSTFRRQTVAVYDDTNRKITIKTDSKIFDDKLIKSEALYDGLGRTTESREYETATDYVASLTEYDSLGRAYKSSNPFRPYLSEQPQWTTTSFDDLGRVTEVKSPDNGKIRREYWGSSVRIYDQANRSRAGVSDALGRLTKVVEYDDGADLETFYTYDVLGRLRKTVQGGQSRYFMYNDLGRLICAKQPEQNANANLNITDPITGNSGWSVKYEYDNNGNVISTTDARNITVTGTYDNLNRLTLRDYSDSTPDVAFTFDNTNIPNSKGQLTAVVSSVSANYYTAFDELGRIKSSQQVTSGQIYNFPNYVYDLSGALIEQTYPSGRVVRTESDNIGRLSKVTSQNPNQAERIYINNLTYNAFGAVSQARLGNGRWESAQFDAKTMQTTQIGLGYSIGNASQLKIEYNYGTTTLTTSDNNGSLRQQKISYAGQTAPIIQNYTYDYLNRLKSATETVNSSQTWKQTFLYDRFGNRRFDTANTTTLPANNGIYNPQIDANTNKFLVSEGYNYDAEGNLTSNPENQLFQYDANNRQTQVTNTATSSTANYFYDGSSKRVRKLVGQEETIFVYDGFGKMVAEYATTLDTSRPKAISYLTTDALGSPRIITDGGGNVISRHDYQPFGEEIAANIGGRLTTQGYQANDGVRQQFTGYERDVESGLDYAQARYFSSKHGRFTSVDPLTASANMKNPQTFNRYSYALNSPYKFVDPLGLKSIPYRGCPAGGTSSCMGGGQGYDESDLGEESANAIENNTSDIEPNVTINCTYCIVVTLGTVKIYKGEKMNQPDGKPLMTEVEKPDGTTEEKQVESGYGAGTVNAISITENGKATDPSDFTLEESISTGNCSPAGACNAIEQKANSPVSAYPDGNFYDVQAAFQPTQAAYDKTPEFSVEKIQTLTLRDSDGNILDQKKFSIVLTKTTVTTTEIKATTPTTPATPTVIKKP